METLFDIEYRGKEEQHNDSQWDVYMKVKQQNVPRGGKTVHYA